MSTPIFLLVLGEGFTEAWYQLSKQEQDDLWAQVQDVDRRAGAAGIFSAIRVGRTKAYSIGPVIEYPDFDSYRHKVAELEKLDWYRYWFGKTVLGTRMDINL